MRQTLQQLQLRQILLLIIFITTFFSFNNNLFGQTQNDSVQIKETVLNYIEGLEYNDVSRVEKAMHPDLAKRDINKDNNGNDNLRNMTTSSLVGYAKTFDYTQLYKTGIDPKILLKVDVLIYDISTDIATVKAIQNKFAFFDYIHLGKINGEWKIINILWAWTD
jgi:hypothetical protein